MVMAQESLRIRAINVSRPLDRYFLCEPCDLELNHGFADWSHSQQESRLDQSQIKGKPESPYTIGSPTHTGMFATLAEFVFTV